MDSYPTITFTRRQVADLVDVSDDVMAFWLKRGLLRPVSGGGGRGDHRLFDFRQVHVAALLAELRQHQLNIDGLAGFAAEVQAIILAADATGLTDVEEYWDACELSGSLRRFRAGEEELILPPGADPAHAWTQSRPAVSEAEIEARFHDHPGVVAAARKLTEQDARKLRLYTDLITTEHVARAKRGSEWQWVIPRSAGEEFSISSGSTNGGFYVPPEAKSAIVLYISAIIREVWTRFEQAGAGK